MNHPLSKLGWSEIFQQQLISSSNSAHLPARVIREDRGRYTVHTGDNTAPAQLSGAFLNTVQSPLDHPTVGDWILMQRMDPDGEYVINALLERTSLFKRQSAGKTSGDQSLAANIDYLFIIAGLDRDYNPKRIQRYLTQAWNSGAQPVVILNKSDLVEDPDMIATDLQSTIPDTPVHAVSATCYHGLDKLEPYFVPGSTVALSGSSGVGKSSLINALLGEQRLLTQANRADDNRGRHTTTWRELIPMETGACIIDLPGMRELQLTGDETGVTKSFPEIEELARHCRFRNCQHGNEPGCAVQEALDNGELSPERFAQYTKLRFEAAVTRKRAKHRKSKKPQKPTKRDDKNAFFKEVTNQHRKNIKQRRKYGQLDGF